MNIAESNEPNVGFFTIATHKQSSNDILFGLCDDNNETKEPAYMDNDGNEEKGEWSGVVRNSKGKGITFVAIDHCPEYDKVMDGAKRCDCALIVDGQIIFVELKKRAYSGWLANGAEQLNSTIAAFNGYPDSSELLINKAYISNCLRPRDRPNLQKNYTQTVNAFFKETGCILKVQRNIVID